ncbi:MAG: hypothetical protein U0835_19280 [Isosphaeraceae bacterium]
MLAGLHHERAWTRRSRLLAEARGSELVADASSPAAVNVRELRRTYDRQTRLPRRLVEATARAISKAHQDWIDARRTLSFPLFLPRCRRSST